MRKIKLFTALSLDNFIARPDGAIDWLFQGDDFGYFDFIDSIDTSIQGRKTYEKVLQLGGTPDARHTNYVFTRSEKFENTEHVIFVNSDILDFCKKLKTEEGKDIWLVGGGEINSILLNNDLIDELILSIHPVYLGEGIPLFPKIEKQIDMKLVKSKTYENGLLQLTYQL